MSMRLKIHSLSALLFPAKKLNSCLIKSVLLRNRSSFNSQYNLLKRLLWTTPKAKIIQITYIRINPYLRIKIRNLRVY